MLAEAFTVVTDHNWKGLIVDDKQKDDLRTIGLDYDVSTKAEFATALLKSNAENRKLKRPGKRSVIVDATPNRGEPNRGRLR